MDAIKKLITALKLLAYVMFWIGLGFGTHVRWKHLQNSGWLVGVALLSSSSTLLCLVLSLRIDNRLLRSVAPLICTFSPSFLLGVLAFSQTEQCLSDNYEIIMDLLLTVSLGVYVLWATSSRSFTSAGSPVIIHLYEISALSGLALAVLISGYSNTFGVICSIVCTGVIIFSLHRRSLIAVLVLPIYVSLNVKTILSGEDYVNRESLGIFALIAVTESAIDLFASNYTSLTTWQPVFDTPLCVLRLLSVGVLCTETALILLVGHSLSAHKEWWVVIPLFTACTLLFWLPSHFFYLMVNWKLWSRVKKAVDIFKSDTSRTLLHIFSSRGLRHFALFTYPLMVGNAVITFVLFMWSWTTQTETTCGLMLVCFPLQLILVSLLRDMSTNLGGSCCGYALITPSVLRSFSGDAANIKNAQVSSSFATRSLRLIQEFFNHHLIEDGGCEYYSERVSEGVLLTSLNKFFSMRTKQGVGYDTYLLYYSGPVNEAGDWVLKDGVTLTYEGLLQVWTNHDVSQTSRLILVLDTAKSNFWVPLVRRTHVAYVGVQTLYVMKNSELSQTFAVGDFTRDWVDFNCNPHSDVYSEGFVSPIISTYGISPYWSYFTFHEPSVDDMDKHWRDNFSISIKPLIHLYSLFDSKRLCYICRCCSKCLAYCRLTICPPNQLDIGHGFKLLRYFKTSDSIVIS